MLNLEESAGYQRIYKKGEITTRREDIQDLLSSRFGEKSTDIQNQVQLLDDVKALHSLLRQLFSVNTMEEARGIVQDAVSKSTPQNKAVNA